MSDTAMSDTAFESLAADTLYGCAEIAKFMGITLRAAEHLIEKKRIPHNRLGRTISARKSRIRAYLEATEVVPHDGD
jgi:excisionase family DNA binding protein